MKLRYAQEIFARYPPDTELLLEAPDGARYTIHHMEDHLVPKEKSKTTTGLCFVPDEPVRRKWEYATTQSKRLNDVGLEEASVPVEPEGDGWEMVCAQYIGGSANRFQFWWKR